MRLSRFTTSTMASLALGLNVLVILQGAFVRATGSGAGCGSHWPTCNGQVVPLGQGAETAIEFSHRLLSLAVLILGGWLLSRAFRARRERPGLFAWASGSFLFLVVEALLGGATVLLGYTGENVSTGRGVLVAVHLVNSLLLVGALTGTVLYARERAPEWPLRLASQSMVVTVLAIGLLGMLVLIFSGGIAAMGSTMFPSESLAEGLAADFDAASHPLVRLRVLHPVIAITVGIYLFLSLGLARLLKPVAQARHLARMLTLVYLVQLAVGTLNFAMLAPVVLQILHLALAVAAFSLLSAVSVTSLGFPAAAGLRAVSAGKQPGAETGKSASDSTAPLENY
jgi:cytochrome c oxidase assembly protein subunit 15